MDDSDRIAAQPKPYPFQDGIIIHVNSFTRRIEGGYQVTGGQKASRFYTPAELCRYLEYRTKSKVDFQLV